MRLLGYETANVTTFYAGGKQRSLSSTPGKGIQSYGLFPCLLSLPPGLIHFCSMRVLMYSGVMSLGSNGGMAQATISEHRHAIIPESLCVEFTGISLFARR